MEAEIHCDIDSALTNKINPGQGQRRVTIAGNITTNYWRNVWASCFTFKLYLAASSITHEKELHRSHKT